jgi:hypothetical protein
MPGYSSPENVSRPTSDLGRLIRRQRHHNLARSTSLLLIGCWGHERRGGSSSQEWR